MSKSKYGTSGGVELTDELIERLVQEAEDGYDVTVPLAEPRYHRVLREHQATTSGRRAGRMLAVSAHRVPGTASPFVVLALALVVAIAVRATTRYLRRTRRTPR